MYVVEKLVKTAFRCMGVDIGRVKPRSDPNYHLCKAIQHFGVDLILDVGANAGQFISTMRAGGYKGRAVSFEPLSTAHTELVRRAAVDTFWHVHDRCAIGATDGEVQINISGNSVSSSVLPILDTHTTSVPESAYCGVETVPLRRLDDVAHAYVSLTNRTLLKIDTQGYEWAVLDGAAGILPCVKCVLCEMSLVPLYRGERSWLDLLSRLTTEGFTLWAIKRGYSDHNNGRTLQIDGFFARL